MIENDSCAADTCLVFDAMSIRKDVMFSKTEGRHEGFSDYRQDILCTDPDEVASEALVFMLIGPRIYWTYPVASKTLRMKMKNAAVRELLKNDIFSSLRCHDIHNHDTFQDIHSTQISKAINEFFNKRLLRYGQTFTENKILNSNIGKRHVYSL